EASGMVLSTVFVSKPDTITQPQDSAATITIKLILTDPPWGEDVVRGARVLSRSGSRVGLAGQERLRPDSLEPLRRAKARSNQRRGWGPRRVWWASAKARVRAAGVGPREPR